MKKGEKVDKYCCSREDLKDNDCSDKIFDNISKVNGPSINPNSPKTTLNHIAPFIAFRGVVIKRKKIK